MYHFSRFQKYAGIHNICFSFWHISLCMTDSRSIYISTYDPIWSLICTVIYIFLRTSKVSSQFDGHVRTCVIYAPSHSRCFFLVFTLLATDLIIMNQWNLIYILYLWLDITWYIYIYNNAEAHYFKVIEPWMAVYSAVGAVQGVYSLPSNLFSSIVCEPWTSRCSSWF